MFVGRWVTQGGTFSPTVFNLMVGAIVREWITQLKEQGVDMEDIRKLVACFYADNGLVAARDANTLQKAFDILTGRGSSDQHNQDGSHDVRGRAHSHPPRPGRLRGPHVGSA